ncbi:rhomboid-related protein 4-like isoform X2 [Myripristis murdjan]|uniref:rhomboid-related protein 4-like isoform X2 n=1 Tax=Myripristis murdjan TaxID=586833 RepID=UPI001175E80A|nr:rhomboid-related protein 4-like isoform X2 [Myripristis murdjan]
MQRQQRGSQMGLLLLASQLFQVGLGNIPPVTLAVLGLNVYYYLVPIVPLSEACMSVRMVYWDADWLRLLLSPLHHANEWHLGLNMSSLLWKGITLERRVGGAWFLYLLSVFYVLTGLVYLLLGVWLTEITKDQSYSWNCAVGFSGVLFALTVISNYYCPLGVTNVIGIHTTWVELTLIQLVAPGTSLISHLAGILVGLLYIAGPLRKIMKAFAGYSGTRRRHSADQRYTTDYTTNDPTHRTAAYTGGLTEEEQLDAAIRNSLNDRGCSSQRAAAPPQDFHFSEEEEEVNREEIRRRRLMKLDSKIAGKKKSNRFTRQMTGRGIPL